MKYDIVDLETDEVGLDENKFWTGTKKLFLFICITIAIATGAIILVIYLSNQTTEIKGAMRIENLMEHLKDLQEIANNFQGTRTTGLGMNASAEYVVKKLTDETDHDIYTQVFNITTYRMTQTPEFHFLQPSTTTYVNQKDFLVFSYSGNGNVTAGIHHVTDRGCQPGDWTDFPEGKIALVRRGNCNFSVKLGFAISANAVGLIIYNSGENGDNGLYNGNLGITSLAPFPIIATTNSLGTLFATLEDEALVNLFVEGGLDITYTRNVIAETKNGNPGRVIVIGSHLDSVPAGPGINDNGSGSSLNLQLAIQAAKYLKNPKQKIRFIWFGAEELGLLGSSHYVRDLQLHHPEELKKIVLNLNFDMVASPNYQRGIYNGSASTDLSILKASTKIQRLFEQFFTIKNISYIAVPFTGRSDYGPFIDVGIPAGGLFTGAEEIKSEASRKLFGGLGNTAFDPCYHKECDTIDNINQEVYLQNAEAAAYVVQLLATSKDIEKLLNGGEAERWSSQMREWKHIKNRKHLHNAH